MFRIFLQGYAATFRRLRGRSERGLERMTFWHQNPSTTSFGPLTPSREIFTAPVFIDSDHALVVGWDLIPPYSLPPLLRALLSAVELALNFHLGSTSVPLISNTLAFEPIQHSHCARSDEPSSLAARPEAFGGSGLWLYGLRLPFVDPRFNINFGGLTFGVTSQFIGTTSMPVGLKIPKLSSDDAETLTRIDSPLASRFKYKLTLHFISSPSFTVDAQVSGSQIYGCLDPGPILGDRPAHLGMGLQGPQISSFDARFNFLFSSTSGHITTPTHLSMGLQGPKLSSFDSRFNFCSAPPRSLGLGLHGVSQQISALSLGASRLNKFKFNQPHLGPDAFDVYFNHTANQGRAIVKSTLELQVYLSTTTIDLNERSLDA
ncbi:hypothetical protein C8R46DRAFT_1219798 [Mycena filopes]|nr:hypothetical protein C8R46DRAFT_1219798 [Mycena filopes]